MMNDNAGRSDGVATASVPYDRITTLFLDAGNTLVSVDFDWVAAELGSRGVPVEVPELIRSECAARPVVSARLATRDSTESTDFFTFYLRAVVDRLDAADPLGPSERTRLVSEVGAVLKAGGGRRLWSRVMPGVRESLDRFRAAGLQLVVVSNSDGTVEDGLRDQELRHQFDVVVDSTVVGYEKPDPRIFHHACEASGADPSTTLHVGDIYHADVVGARAAGIHALLLDPFDDWVDVDCDRAPDLAALAGRMEGRRAGERA